MSDLALRRLSLAGASPQSVSLRRLSGTSAFVALAIYLTSHLAFALRLPGSGIGFVWPPNAVLLASLLLLPGSWGPVIAATLVGHMAAHTQDGVPIAMQLTAFLGNVSQALLAAILIRAFGGPRPRLDDLRMAGVFMAAAVLAPAAASVLPAATYVQVGWAPDFWSGWRARTFANVITILTLTPVILLAPGAFADLRRDTRRVAEFCALLLGTYAVGALAFGWAPAGRAGVPALLYMPLPLLLWAAVRFGVFGLSSALTIIALQWISHARDGLGPFTGGNPRDAIFSLQVLLFIVAVPLTMLAALGQERKGSESALRQSEARNRAILTAIPDLMFLQTADGLYLDYHARDPSRLLVGPEQFLGRRTEDVMPPSLAARFSRAFTQATDQEPAVVRYSLPIRGVERWFEARVVRCEGDTRLTIVQDVTERTDAEARLRESERRYVLATTAAGVGVWQWDVETNHVFVDPAIHSDLGLHLGELPSTPAAWLTLVHPEDKEHILGRLQAQVEGLAPVLEQDCRVAHKDGSLRWFHVRGAVVERSGGRPVRVSGTATDITDRKQAEEALLRAQADLARIARISALGELAATIAHEVDQPLCAIVANANACLRWLENDDVMTSEIREALADVVTDGNRASEVIRRTRELFRHNATTMSAVDLNDVVHTVLSLTRPRADEGRATLQTDLAGDLPPVLGDRIQLEQVVFNLVVNGLDAMRGVDRPRLLELRSWTEDGSVNLAVSDTGTGLDPGQAERIFDPFFTTKPDGLGMGLAITRSIVRAHGGNLQATSNQGGGATFQITLPRREASGA